jgi:hypothetical protein
LKDQSAIQNAEKVLAEFKAVDYDVSKFNDAVSTFEAKAVSRRCVLVDVRGRRCNLQIGVRRRRSLGPAIRRGRRPGQERMRMSGWTLKEALVSRASGGLVFAHGVPEETGVSGPLTGPPLILQQVSAAKETVTKIAAEEKGLNETLSNIKDARPFEDLTVSRI